MPFLLQGNFLLGADAPLRCQPMLTAARKGNWRSSATRSAASFWLTPTAASRTGCRLLPKARLVTGGSWPERHGLEESLTEWLLGP